MKKLLLNIIFAVFLFSCSGTDKTNAQSIEKIISTVENNYQNQEFRFSLNCPETWDILEDSLSSLVYLLTPTDSLDSFQEMINVVIGSSEGKTLEQFFKLNDTIVQKSFDELIQLENAKTININGVDFKTVKYNYTFGGYKLTAKIYVALKGDFSYILNCSALQSTFPDFENEFKNIVRSFKIK